MSENFLPVSSMPGSVVIEYFPLAAAKATIDSRGPIDLGCIPWDGTQDKCGGADPQSLMGE
jgi:hypothetical protein